MALAAAAARVPLLRPSQALASLVLGLQPITPALMLTALPALAADLQAA